MMAVCLLVHASCHEVVVEFLYRVELTLEVNHRTCFALLINKVKSRDVGVLCHLGVISTEGRSDVYDTRTVVRSYVVAEDYAECLFLHLHKLVASVLRSKYLFRMSCCIFCYECGSEVVQFLARLHPRHELLVVQTLKLRTLHVVNHAPRAHLLVLVERQKVALLAFLVCLEVRTHERLSHNERHRLAVVEVVCLDGHIVNLRANAECHVRRQGPRSCGPCDKVRLAPLCPFCLRILDEELGCGGEVLHVTITTRLIELVRAKTRTCTRRIRLDGIALIEQTLVVELLEEPPKSLDILVVVCDIGMVEVNEVAHALCQLAPLSRELHDVLTATMVVFLSRDILL